MKFILPALIVMGASFAYASELDNEKQITNVMERAKDLPATLIMRKNEKTGQVEVAHLKQTVGEAQLTEKEAMEMAFTSVAENQTYKQENFSELDSDNSRESWYFYYGYGYGYNYNYGYSWYGYYPTYNYYGAYYPYYPYYNYNYGGYAYYYYRPYWGYYW